MKKSLFTFALLLFTGFLFAQHGTTGAVTSAIDSKPGMVLSELASNIDPKAFTKAFDRDTWKKNLDNIANPMAFGKSLTDLALGLSPDAFIPDWAANRTAWLSKAKGITKYADATSLLKEFETYLNPKMMLPDWTTKKATWLKSLDSLK